jgi:DNA-binding MarR family transcriptional regulator
MDCLCLNTRRAARTLTRLYEEHLRPCNLTAAQFGLLSLLAARPNLSQQDLAETLDLDQTTLSRNLRLLVSNKWIKRTRSKEDRRQTLYTITPAGLELRSDALPHWNRAQQQMRASLGSDWETALAIVKRLSIVASAA